MIVGGFLGGGVELIPAGHGLLCLQWLTPDRLNIEGAVFTIVDDTGASGPYTVEGGTDGRAEITVPSGDYTVSVTHAGVYDNDKPQKVHVESTQAYLVLFGAATVMGSILVQDTMPGATMTIVEDSTGDAVYTGDVVPMEINTGMGSFTVTIEQFNKTVTLQITVAGKTKLDLSSITITITVASDLAEFGDSSLTFNNAPVTPTFRCLPNIGTFKFRAVSSMEWFEDRPVEAVASVNVKDADLTISKPTYSEPFVITSSHTTMTLPKVGSYYFTVCGGGGGGGGGTGGYLMEGVTSCGGNGGSGGGGGHVVSRYVTASTLDYSVTIGAGGKGGSGTAGNSNTNATAGGAGGTTTVSGAVSISSAGGTSGSGASSARRSSTPYSGGGGTGGRGGSASTISIRGSTINTTTGTSGGSGKTASLNTDDRYGGNQSSNSTNTTMPSSSFQRFSGSGRGGTGGFGGAFQVATSGDYRWVHTDGGRGGGGGHALVVDNKDYGKGGNGGDGGYGEYYLKGNRAGGTSGGSAGTSGQSGVVMVEMVL